jgi:uncharacterized protein (TIGR02246 family)
MTRLAAGAVAAVTLAALSGCAQPDTRDTDTKAIKDLEIQWVRECAAKNADKVLAHYADGAVLMPPGMAASVGKDAIGKVLKEMVADPALSLKFQAGKVEVARSGDLAYSQGSYTMTATDPTSKRPVHDHGSYVTVYRKQADGSWKAVADVASSAVAPSPPAPPAPSAAAKKRAKKKR